MRGVGQVKIRVGMWIRGGEGWEQKDKGRHKIGGESIGVTELKGKDSITDPYI